MIRLLENGIMTVTGGQGLDLLYNIDRAVLIGGDPVLIGQDLARYP